MPERQGLVTEVTAPNAGAKMGSAKVGSRTVRFFWTNYDSDDPTEVRRRLEKAAMEGFEVVCSGDELPNQRGGAPMFKVLEVARAAPGASQAPQNGSQTSTSAAASEPKHYVGRDPGTADFWLATRWAWSLAAEILAKTGKEPSVTAIAELAGEIFQGSYSEALKHKEWADSLGGVE